MRCSRYGVLSRRYGKVAGTLPNKFLKEQGGARRDWRNCPTSLSHGQRFIRSAASEMKAPLALSCYTFPDEAPEMIEPAVMKTMAIMFLPCRSMARTSNPGERICRFDGTSCASGRLPAEGRRDERCPRLEVRVPFLGELF